MPKTILVGLAIIALLVVLSRAEAPVEAQNARVTFSDSIAPIVYDNCVTCHRPGEAAPFSLITYDDVRNRGALIAKVTQSRYMPPWQATHGYGEFEGERRLTDAQIETIAAWVKNGMPQGDPARMPKLPVFTTGWRLGTPDLVLEMPKEFEVPAGGPDIFRNFVIPSGLAQDKWVRAVEFRPAARKVVHHALFAYVRGGAYASIDGADGKPDLEAWRRLAPIPTSHRPDRSAAGQSEQVLDSCQKASRCRWPVDPTSSSRCTSIRPARWSMRRRPSASISRSVRRTGHCAI